jgi:putative acetyltransferase
MTTVRAEIAEDYPAVRQVNELAFGRKEEALLVDKLRAAANPHISLVAVKNGQVVGHTFFSPVSIEISNSAALVLALGPLAILPEYQKQGLGSQLAREGLKECQRIGCNVALEYHHA